MEKVIVCPECKNDIQLEEGRTYVVGDILECLMCGSELEVTSQKDQAITVELVEEEK